MIFNSLAFAVFLPLVFLLYWVIPHRFRWIFLIAANGYFYYCGSPGYLSLLILIIFISFCIGLLLERTPSKGRKGIMWLGVVLVLASLLYFKYFSFALEILGSFALPVDRFTSTIIMPLGISFYTFKAISYIVDVYRGKYPAEHHPGYYAAYISYFPDVVSGPIDRAELILPQLKAEKTFNYDQAVYGLRLMLLGFAKKLLLADALTKYVDKIFDQVTLYQGFTLVLASLLYTIQIYCDFSGYSDIAIGTSRLFGINLMENFRSPYFARSIKEFWSRWHISLSTWFRDYVYIPLGGNRVSRLRRSFNLMVTFLVSGLWHGADYTFILWGGLHGLYQVVENLIHDLRKKRKVVSLPGPRARTIRAFAETVITFLLVSFAWIFFRSDGLGDALYFLTHMFADLSVTKALTQMGLSTFNLVKLGGFIFLLGCYDYFAGKRDLLREMSRLPVLLRWGIYLSLTLLIVVLKIHNGTSQQFIYFRF